MAEPKKKLSSTRSGNRRSHLGLKTASSTMCSNCRMILASHTVCLECGFYKGNRVISKQK